MLLVTTFVVQCGVCLDPLFGGLKADTGIDFADGFSIDRLCGSRSLLVILHHSGRDSELERICVQLPDHGNDASFAELSRLTERGFGLYTGAVDWHSAPPHDAPPAIILIESPGQPSHYVAVMSWRSGIAEISDGNYRQRIPIADLRRFGWTGHALHVAATEAEVSSLVPAWWKSGRAQFIASSFLLLAAAVTSAFHERKSDAALKCWGSLDWGLSDEANSTSEGEVCGRRIPKQPVPAVLQIPGIVSAGVYSNRVADCYGNHFDPVVIASAGRAIGPRVGSCGRVCQSTQAIGNRPARG